MANSAEVDTVLKYELQNPRRFCPAAEWLPRDVTATITGT